MESFRHGEHLPQGIAYTAAFLAHMYRDGDIPVPQRLQCFNELTGGGEAFRCVAEAQRDTQGAFFKGTGQQFLYRSHLGGTEMLAVVAGHSSAHCARPNQHSCMDGSVIRLAKIAGDGVGRNICTHFAGDGGKVVQNVLAVFAVDGGNRETAVAVDNGGEALRKLQFAEMGTKDLRIGMAVDINETGRYSHTGGVNDLCCPVQVRADGRDLAVLNGYICRKAVRAGAVHYDPVPDQNIIH